MGSELERPRYRIVAIRRIFDRLIRGEHVIEGPALNAQS